jgi:hypothetical protein
VLVEELTGIPGEIKPTGRKTTLFVNPDPSAPLNLLRPGNVDQTAEEFDIGRFEVHDIEISKGEAQDINIPVVQNQGPQDEVTGWPKTPWEAPRWENPRWENPRWENPRWENPRWENPRWENEGWENETISDGDVENGSYRHVRAAYTSIGNTTSAYDVRVVVTGADPSLRYQLIAYKLYTTAGEDLCEHSLVGNTQVLVNIPNYDPSASNLNSPPPESVQNTTIHLHPGETVYTVLVAFDPTSRTFIDAKLPLSSVLFAARPHAVNTADADAGVRVPPVVFNDSPFLTFTAQPTDTSVNTPIGQSTEQPVRVRAQNGQGAVIPNLPITIAIGNNPSDGTLSGTLTRLTDLTGVATFGDLTIDVAGTGYTLVASAPSVTSATSSSFNVAVLVGTVVDATGDSSAGGGTPPFPDLISATLTVDQGDLNISVRFAPGTFSAATTLVNLVLDTDENATTGSPGVDSECVNDAATVGTDFVVNTSSNFYGSNVVVHRYVNQATPPARSCNTFAGPSTVGTASFVADGVDFVIPLSALGNDDGRLRFKVLTGSHIPSVCPSCFTTVQDYMPNVGFPPGRVPTPPLPPIGLLQVPIPVLWVSAPIQTVETSARDLRGGERAVSHMQTAWTEERERYGVGIRRLASAASGSRGAFFRAAR